MKSEVGGTAVDEGTVLFAEGEGGAPLPLGRVLDIFGPVTQPLYSVLFNESILFHFGPLEWVEGRRQEA